MRRTRSHLQTPSSPSAESPQRIRQRRTLTPPLEAPDETLTNELSDNSQPGSSPNVIETVTISSAISTPTENVDIEESLPVPDVSEFGEISYEVGATSNPPAAIEQEVYDDNELLSILISSDSDSLVVEESQRHQKKTHRKRCAGMAHSCARTGNPYKSYKKKKMSASRELAKSESRIVSRESSQPSTSSTSVTSIREENISTSPQNTLVLRIDSTEQTNVQTTETVEDNKSPQESTTSSKDNSTKSKMSTPEPSSTSTKVKKSKKEKMKNKEKDNKTSVTRETSANTTHSTEPKPSTTKVKSPDKDKKNPGRSLVSTNAQGGDLKQSNTEAEATKSKSPQKSMESKETGKQGINLQPTQSSSVAVVSERSSIDDTSPQLSLAQNNETKTTQTTSNAMAINTLPPIRRRREAPILSPAAARISQQLRCQSPSLMSRLLRSTGMQTTMSWYNIIPMYRGPSTCSLRVHVNIAAEFERFVLRQMATQNSHTSETSSLYMRIVPPVISAATTSRSTETDLHWYEIWHIPNSPGQRFWLSVTLSRTNAFGARNTQYRAANYRTVGSDEFSERRVTSAQRRVISVTRGTQYDIQITTRDVAVDTRDMDTSMNILSQAQAIPPSVPSTSAQASTENDANNLNILATICRFVSNQSNGFDVNSALALSHLLRSEFESVYAADQSIHVEINAQATLNDSRDNQTNENEINFSQREPLQLRDENDLHNVGTNEGHDIHDNHNNLRQHRVGIEYEVATSGTLSSESVCDLDETLKQSLMCEETIDESSQDMPILKESSDESEPNLKEEKIKTTNVNLNTDVDQNKDASTSRIALETLNELQANEIWQRRPNISTRRRSVSLSPSVESDNWQEITDTMKAKSVNDVSNIKSTEFEHCTDTITGPYFFHNYSKVKPHEPLPTAPPPRVTCAPTTDNRDIEQQNERRHSEPGRVMSTTTDVAVRQNSVITSQSSAVQSSTPLPQILVSSQPDEVWSTRANTHADMESSTQREALHDLYTQFVRLSPNILWTGRFLRPPIDIRITMRHIAGNAVDVIDWINDVQSISRFHTLQEFQNSIENAIGDINTHISLVYFFPINTSYIRGYEDAFNMLKAALREYNVARLRNRVMDIYLYPLEASETFDFGIQSAELNAFWDTARRPNLLLGVIIHDRRMLMSPSSYLFSSTVELPNEFSLNAVDSLSNGIGVNRQPSTEATEHDSIGRQTSFESTTPTSSPELAYDGDISHSVDGLSHTDDTPVQRMDGRGYFAESGDSKYAKNVNILHKARAQEREPELSNASTSSPPATEITDQPIRNEVGSRRKGSANCNLVLKKRKKRVVPLSAPSSSSSYYRSDRLNSDDAISPTGTIDESNGANSSVVTDERVIERRQSTNEDSSTRRNLGNTTDTISQTSSTADGSTKCEESQLKSSSTDINTLGTNLTESFSLDDDGHKGSEDDDVEAIPFQSSEMQASTSRERIDDEAQSRESGYIDGTTRKTGSTRSTMDAERSSSSQTSRKREHRSTSKHPEARANMETVKESTKNNETAADDNQAINDSDNNTRNISLETESSDSNTTTTEEKRIKCFEGERGNMKPNEDTTSKHSCESQITAPQNKNFEMIKQDVTGAANSEERDITLDIELLEGNLREMEYERMLVEEDERCSIEESEDLTSDQSQVTSVQTETDSTTVEEVIQVSILREHNEYINLPAENSNTGFFPIMPCSPQATQYNYWPFPHAERELQRNAYSTDIEIATRNGGEECSLPINVERIDIESIESTATAAEVQTHNIPEMPVSNQVEAAMGGTRAESTSPKDDLVESDEGEDN